MATTLPAGTIVYSMLDEHTFRQEMGAGENWIMADGRSIVGQGTRYEQLGFTHVPNLCGVFVRGKNNGRADGYQNPDGELPLGQMTQDRFMHHNHTGQTGDDSPDHSHGFGGYPFGASYGGDNSTENLGTAPNGFYRQTDGASVRHKHAIATDGGLETSPKSITLNAYIKLG